MEPLGSGRLQLLSRVRLQRRLHSCRVNTSTRSADSTEARAVARADNTPNCAKGIMSREPVPVPASTCVTA